MNIFSKKFVLSFAALAVLGLAAGTGVYKANAAEGALTDAQKKEVEQVVIDYLKNNPEAIIESLNAHQAKQVEDQEKAASAKLGDHTAFLTAADAPSAGNPKATVTVIEFFDYNCGYCKRAIPDVKKAVADDKDVRFVFHEMPILGPTSLTAAQWALAAHKQGKYFEYHIALMEHNGPKDDAALEAVAKQIGLDVEKAKVDAKSPEVQKMIDDSMAVARDLDINGTPAFIIGDNIVRGYMGPDGLEKGIAQEREKAKTKK